jgi:hypothetical protein
VLFAHTHSYLSTNSPLFIACRSAAPAAAVTARLLIAAGADVNSKNFGQGTEVSHLETPLHAAAEVLTPTSDLAVAAPSGNEAESGAALGHNEVSSKLFRAASHISNSWRRSSTRCWRQALI